MNIWICMKVWQAEGKELQDLGPLAVHTVFFRFTCSKDDASPAPSIALHVSPMSSCCINSACMGGRLRRISSLIGIVSSGASVRSASPLHASVAA